MGSARVPVWEAERQPGPRPGDGAQGQTPLASVRLVDGETQLGHTPHPVIPPHLLFMKNFRQKKKISKTKFCRFASSFWRAGSPQLGGICAGLMQPHGSSRPAEARATCTPAPGPPSALPAHCCVSSRGLPEPCPLVSAPPRPYPPLSIPMPAWCWGTESLKCTC